MDFFYLFLFGYLVGSISPGYFFGRIFKGIDIRKYNHCNTGATNTYLTVGPIYGAITGAIDFLKTPFVYYIALSGFKFLNFETLSPDLVILVGLAAVIGHIFPFYLGFRGGRGIASLYGLIFINLFFSQSVFALILFIGTIFYAILVSQRPEVKKLLAEAPLRKFFKLAGFVLPLGFFLISEGFFTKTVLLLLMISLVFDFSRFLFPRLNRRYLDLRILSKEKESGRFSGYSLFLLSSFLLFQFFPREIAAVSLTFFIIGDVFAPFGTVFMAKEILHGKTWGGVSLIFVLTFIAGLFLKSLASLTFSFSEIVLASFLTAFLDQFSFFVDDNILVPLGTATLLWIIGLAIVL